MSPKAQPVSEAIDWGSMTFYEKLARIGREIGTIAKAGRNEAHNYSYVTESDVVEKVRPLLADAGILIFPQYRYVSVTPFTTQRGAASFLTVVEGTFTVTDGETTIEVITVGEGTDTGDKGSYKAMTGAKKYALLHLFLLATGDDPERAREDEVMPRGASAEARFVASAQQLRMIFGKSEEVGLSQDEFKTLVKDKTGKESTRDLTNSDVDVVLAALEEAKAGKAAVDALVAAGGEIQS